MSDWRFVINGTEKDLYTAYGIRVTGVTGAGMPPIENIVTRYAISDGAAHQRTLARERVIQLACVYEQMTQTEWHAKRKTLIADISRDARDSATFTLRYYGAITTAGYCLEIPVRYDGGLEMEYTAADPLRAFALRLMSVDPAWSIYDTTAGGVSTSTLATETAIADANYIMLRGTDGAWEPMGGGLSGPALEIKANPMTGVVFVGGVFTTAYNGTGGGDALTVNNITYWDGTSWHTCGAGVTHTTTGSAAVNAIEFGPNGYVHVGGRFTTAGTEVLDSIATWHSLTTTWVDSTTWSWASGVWGGAVNAISRAENGDLWVGGEFTARRLMGGTTDGNQKYLLRWDYAGGDWSTSDYTTAPTSFVRAVRVSPDGTTPIVGGAFTAINGVSAAAVAKLADGVWQGLGAGMAESTAVGPSVYALNYGDDQMLYAGGGFATADGAVARRVAQWNGGGWSPVGAGLGGITPGEVVYDLAVGNDGRLYAACPTIETSGRVPLLDQFAVFSDGAWHSLDLDMPGSAESRAVAVDTYGRVYVGFNTAGTAVAPGVTSVTNSGTALAYPTITIKRAGGTSAQIQSVINWTTGDEIILPYDLGDGETVTIDLTPGAKSVTSDYRGSILSRVVAGTGLQTFALAPGVNRIAVFVATVGSPTITAAASWRAAYQSVDGA